MVEIRNETQLRAIMQGIAERTIENVSKKVLKMLREYINRDVYKYEYFPNIAYVDGSGRPTYDFYNAWKWRQTQVLIRSMTKELFYDWQSTSNDSDKWIHGSNIEGWAKDARMYMPEILDVNGYTSGLMTPSGRRHFSKLRQPYWQNFLTDLLNRGQLDRWFAEELRNYGVRRV